MVPNVKCRWILIHTREKKGICYVNEREKRSKIGKTECKRVYLQLGVGRNMK